MTSEHYVETEVREDVVRDNALGAVPREQHERVEVVRQPDGEHREHIVQDVGTENRLILEKFVQFIYLVTGLLELALGLRVLLKLIAANPASPFAQMVYMVTDLFVWPFQGLTVTPTAGNGMTLELSTFFAMLIYAVAAWGLAKILYLLFSPTSSRSVSVYHRGRS